MLTRSLAPVHLLSYAKCDDHNIYAHVLRIKNTCLYWFSMDYPLDMHSILLPNDYSIINESAASPTRQSSEVPAAACVTRVMCDDSMHLEVAI